MKRCSNCHNTKSKDEFYKATRRKDGKRSTCKLCDYEAVKEYRLKNQILVRQWAKQYYKKTGKTFIKYLSNKYTSMICRTQYKKSNRHYQYYIGVRVLFSREEFILWGKNNKDYKRLYKTYALLGFPRASAPSIDRIDSDLHYSFDNIQWMTQSQNSAKANQLQRDKKNVIA